MADEQWACYSNGWCWDAGKMNPSDTSKLHMMEKTFDNERGALCEAISRNEALIADVTEKIGELGKRFAVSLGIGVNEVRKRYGRPKEE